MKIDVTETVEQQADVSVLRRRVCGLLEQVQLILDVSECGGFQTVSDNLPTYLYLHRQTASVLLYLLSDYVLLHPSTPQIYTVPETCICLAAQDTSKTL